MNTATDYTNWETNLDTLEGTLLEAAPLRGFFDGGMTSAAEHERSSRLSIIRERLRTAWSGTKPTESQLDAMARADEEYVALLAEHKAGKLKLAELEVNAAILEHRIGLERARHYNESALARSLGG